MPAFSSLEVVFHIRDKKQTWDWTRAGYVSGFSLYSVCFVFYCTETKANLSALTSEASGWFSQVELCGELTGLRDTFEFLFTKRDWVTWVGLWPVSRKSCNLLCEDTRSSCEHFSLWRFKARFILHIAWVTLVARPSERNRCKMVHKLMTSSAIGIWSTTACISRHLTCLVSSDSGRSLIDADLHQCSNQVWSRNVHSL